MTKGYDEKAEIKRPAAERRIAAVNAARTFGHWRYTLARSLKVRTCLGACEAPQFHA